MRCTVSIGVCDSWGSDTNWKTSFVLYADENDALFVGGQRDKPETERRAFTSTTITVGARSAD
jgi:hypothetical protein